ncbi:MAG: signal peptidase I [Candidatus Dormibacterales bacterium]
MAVVAVERRRSATRDKSQDLTGERPRRTPRAAAPGTKARATATRVRAAAPRARAAAAGAAQPDRAAAPLGRSRAGDGAPSPADRAGTLARLAVFAYRLAAGAGLTLLLIVGSASLAIALALHVLGFMDLTVVSPSMTPAIPEGSLVLVRPVQANQVHVGDVISFHPPTEPAIIVTHRVVGRELDSHPALFITKGDANPAPDGWRVPAQGKVAEVAAAFPRLGYLVIFFKTRMFALLLMVGAPLIFTLFVAAEILSGRDATASELTRKAELAL